MKEIINGSFEPQWRFNARRDANRFKDELLCSLNRRRFLAGSCALLLEYMAMRRAIAFPRGGGVSQSLQSITNERTGATYEYLPIALVAMQSGDTILLPAGTTYQYGGATYDYAHWQNTNSKNPSGPGYGNTAADNFNSMFLGLGGILPNCDYGTIEAVGTLNNGRAMITPAYGRLAQDFLATDTEMYFERTTSASNFKLAAANNFIYVLGNYNFGQFATLTMSFAGIDSVNNGLTGIKGTRRATIPAGTIITSHLARDNSAMFLPMGANPGWTFTNLELAYTAYGLYKGVVSSIQQLGSPPGGPYVGSMTINNCYIHDCKQGPGLGYAGMGDNPIFAYFFDTELERMGCYGKSQSADHNIYIGHIGEFLMDNCYSHNVTSTWLVKSRASLNILTYNQIRGERTDSNTGEYENSGIDISNGGLTYLIGNIHQQSLKAAGPAINFDAESSAAGPAGGAQNPLQELYVINSTIIGPANGVGYSVGAGAGKAPVRLNNAYVHNPPISHLAQSTAGSLPARGYFVETTLVGTGGGETNASPLSGHIGTGDIREYLSIAANNVLVVDSSPTITGAASWNCYVNYADPPFYIKAPIAQEGNYFFWDSGHNEPIFSLSSGGITISVTGTLKQGQKTITSITNLRGLGSIAHLKQLSVYVDGVTTGLVVTRTNPSANSVSLSGNYKGTSTTTTITFGFYLYCGITYQTALGDSINACIARYDRKYGPFYQAGSSWIDGSYTTQHGNFTYGLEIQVPPGQLLTVKAPPSGPSWATGVNFWAQIANWLSAAGGIYDPNYSGGLPGVAKQNSSPIAFGASWTSSTTVILQADEHVASSSALPNLFLQNSSPIAIGTNFTEPTSGLVNHNPTANKLVWRRRSIGYLMAVYYAVVPAGGLSNYSDSIYFLAGTNSPYTDSFKIAYTGSVSVIRGVTGFDSNFPLPAQFYFGNSLTITTADNDTMVLAAFRSSGVAPEGFTQISQDTYMNASYATFSSPQSRLTITDANGSSASDAFIIDALVGSGSSPTLIDTITIKGTGKKADFTIPSANAGDILYLMVGDTQLAGVIAVGQFGPPPFPAAVGASPLCTIQNTLAANFDPSFTRGSLALEPSISNATVTETTNLAANPFNGSTFGNPSWATVFSDAIQSDYDYTLAAGSLALNAASNPGSSREGSDLIPHYQVSWSGSPTPGTPIPDKTPRTDVGPALTGAIGALSG